MNNTKLSLHTKTRNWLLKHPRLNPYNISLDRTLRTITSFFRLKPDFIIIGYHKCGTTSLYDYICQHPNVGHASRKEIHYFDLAYWRGPGWYRTYFPTIFTKKKIEKKTKHRFTTGEASPLYVIHPFAPQRIHKLIPNVKIIILLRNPVDRAYSHYQHAYLADQEFASFEETINEDDDRWNVFIKQLSNDEIHDYDVKYIKTPYRSFGKYIDHIKLWYETFPKDQILVLKLEDLESNLHDTLKQTFLFLGLPNFTIKNTEKKNVREYDKMEAKTRNLLLDYYRPYNKKLEEFLERQLNWNQ
ncbi:sulfotransferase domain-containing protein [Candidatus Nitrosotenuis cloacae]|uniref:sulfotransferase domain-containing protein n=1 Tax=Candidatus Nitrosotenuis cloacae TaxID=1603555 RepID=UPI00069C886F|nr:sulfotransferase domain-containing protein [Candidatus Nitrosotenuis cloacae]